MKAYAIIAAIGMVCSISACEDEPPVPPIPVGQPSPAAQASAKAAAKRKAKADAGAPEEERPPEMEFVEADFVESKESRDPFHNYDYLFRTSKPRLGDPIRKVKAPQSSLEELKLTGIVSGRVMMTDSTGFGWVLYTGDYVGKAEMVSIGGTDGREVPLNWRVDRIRGTDVVFIREDAAHPEIPPTTRIVLLYPAGDGT